MKWIKNFGLPTKVTFVFFLAVYIPLLIVGYFSLDLAKDSEKKYGLNLSNYIADLNIASLNYQFDRLKNELLFLSSNNMVQDFLTFYENNTFLKPDEFYNNKKYQKHLLELEEGLTYFVKSNPNLLGIGFFMGDKPILAIEEEKTTKEIQIKKGLDLPTNISVDFLASILNKSEGIWHNSESLLFPFYNRPTNDLNSNIAFVGTSKGPKKIPFFITFYYNPLLNIKPLEKNDLTKLNRSFTLLLKEDNDGKISTLLEKSKNASNIQNFIKKLPQSFLTRDAAEYVDSDLNIYSLRKAPFGLKNLEKISMISFSPSHLIRKPLKNIRNLIVKYLMICSFFVLPLMYLAQKKIISNLHFVVADLIKTGKTLEKSTKGIQSTSEILQKSANFNKRGVDSITLALEQFSHSSQKSKEKIREMISIFKQTSQSATEGKNDINDLALSMDQIVESSKNIFKIINIIENISIQTNILSMNASVEAARAGEHGKGFAVVAEAIRNLAQKSSTAAGEIGKLIQDSIDKSQDGSLKAGRNLGKFKEIIENIESTNSIVESSSRTLDERLGDFQKLSVELTNINKSLNEGTIQTEKHRDIALQLSEEAESLKQSINKILILVEGEKMAHKTKTKKEMT